MKLVLKIQVTVLHDQGISRVKSLQDTRLYFRVIYSSKHKVFVEKICLVDSCLQFEPSECNAILKASRTDRKINNNRYVTKHSNRDLSDLLENEQVL